MRSKSCWIVLKEAPNDCSCRSSQPFTDPFSLAGGACGPLAVDNAAAVAETLRKGALYGVVPGARGARGSSRGNDAVPLRSTRSAAGVLYPRDCCRGSAVAVTGHGGRA